MTERNDNRSSFEERLGYRFKDEALLKRALTHKSALNNEASTKLASYQRLEFLGDRVLAVVIADMLYASFEEADEGELARRLTGLVRNETCAEVATDLDMGQEIILGDGEEQAGGREKAAILGDVCEAVIAAIYLDGGMETAQAFIDRHWRVRMTNWNKPLSDPKTTLQEWAHGRKLPTPTYREVSRSGPDHALSFIVEVVVQGLEPATGEGTSKRDAQQKAASSLLVRQGIWKSDTYG